MVRLQHSARAKQCLPQHMAGCPNKRHLVCSQQQEKLVTIQLQLACMVLALDKPYIAGS